MRSMRTTTAVAVALAALLGLARGAYADANTANDADSLTIRITPSVDLGVDIDTSTARFNPGDSGGDLDVTLALNATYYLVSPASVTIQGNFAKQEVEVVGQALDTWTLDADETIGTDSVQLYALFTENNFGERPDESDFALNGTNNLITTAPQMAGQPVANESSPDVNSRYEMDTPTVGYASPADMDDMAPGYTTQLWLRLDTPATSNFSSEQRFMVTLTAKSGVVN